MRFPLRRFGRPEPLLGESRNDLGVRALPGAIGLHPVQGFAYTSGKHFFTPPDFGFVSIL
jgi:hypothetical protein